MKSEDIEHFIRDGWVIVDVPQPDIIHKTAQALEQKAQELCRADCRLSELHAYVDDDAFSDFNLAMVKYFWQIEFSMRFSHDFLELLKQLSRLDIMVQYMPYLRLARPGKPEVNIDYLKNKQYGQTPYELAVNVPFADVDEDAALRVISGSHRQPEDVHSARQGTEYNVAKGSPAPISGNPDASRRVSALEGVRTVPLAMRVGQAALVSPALVYGQEINRGMETRVTTDLCYILSKPNAFFGAGSE